LPLLGTSVAFRAAKAAQDGFVQGLADELKKTTVRVTAVYPGDFDNLSPLDAAWNDPRRQDDPLTSREVVDAILFTLNLSANAAVRSLVIEHCSTDMFGTQRDSS
jgi:NAD(P)-dependent dehydrogenase (short-subunit alcohol dehydrogenase family)